MVYLWKQLGWLSHILWQIKNVPNHQLENHVKSKDHCLLKKVKIDVCLVITLKIPASFGIKFPWPSLHHNVRPVGPVGFSNLSPWRFWRFRSVWTIINGLETKGKILTGNPWFFSINEWRVFRSKFSRKPIKIDISSWLILIKNVIRKRCTWILG